MITSSICYRAAYLWRRSCIAFRRQSGRHARRYRDDHFKTDFRTSIYLIINMLSFPWQADLTAIYFYFGAKSLRSSITTLFPYLTLPLRNSVVTVAPTFCRGRRRSALAASVATAARAGPMREIPPVPDRDAENLHLGHLRLVWRFTSPDNSWTFYIIVLR